MLLEIATPDAISRVRSLNDTFRQSFAGGVVTVSMGVEVLGADVKAEVLRRVRTFNRFTEKNDPHGEHDLGVFDIAGKLFMWKIDCYDRAMESGSENPGDPAVTTRVLTVMLASEY
jgi:hypothetical protein